MNKRIIVMVMVMVMLLCITACKKNVVSVESTIEQGNTVENKTNTEDTVLETVPGVEENDQDVEDIAWDDSEVSAEEAQSDSNVPSLTVAEPDDSWTEATEPTVAVDTTVPTESVSEEGNTDAEHETPKQLTEYEKYSAMSGEEQMAFMQSFDTIEAFFVWYNNAKAEYEAANPAIEIGNGEIDIGEIIGK